MNRLQVVKNPILLIVVMLGFAAGSANAQTAAARPQELNAKELASIRSAVLRPTATSFWAVTQDFEGNFESVGEHMAAFERECKAQNVKNASPSGILVLHEDPTGKSRFRMSIGIVLNEKVDVKAPLKVANMSLGRAVHHTHVGPYDRLEKVHGGIVSALREKPQTAAKAAPAAMLSTSWPVVLRLLNDPKKAKPAELRTEMIIPVK